MSNEENPSGNTEHTNNACAQACNEERSELVSSLVIENCDIYQMYIHSLVALSYKVSPVNVCSS